MENNLITLSEINSKEDFNKIEVKSFVGFSFKKLYVNNILETCKIINDNGICSIDYSLLEMFKSYILINAYTNINLSDGDAIENYDDMFQLGIIDYVLERIDKRELDFFDGVLKNEINQIQNVENSVSNVLAKVFKQISEKIPDKNFISKTIKDLPKTINKINPETLKILKNINTINK
jgi:hypothetical protein